MRTKFLGTALLSLVLLAFTAKHNQISESVYNSTTLQLSQANFDSLTNAYSVANPSKTWGGRLSKLELQKVINSLGTSATYVPFYFATDAEGHMLTMFAGGTEGQTGGQLVIQNGGGQYSFCPTKCAMQSSSTNVTQTIPASQFQQQQTAFQNANPGATRGGSFSKVAMQAIINSLADYTNVNFRFVTDPSFNKTSLLLIGGSTGQPNGQTLMLRNGNSADAFCPTFCH